MPHKYARRLQNYLHRHLCRNYAKICLAWYSTVDKRSMTCLPGQDLGSVATSCRVSDIERQSRSSLVASRRQLSARGLALQTRGAAGQVPQILNGGWSAPWTLAGRTSIHLRSLILGRCFASDTNRGWVPWSRFSLHDCSSTSCATSCPWVANQTPRSSSPSVANLKCQGGQKLLALSSFSPPPSSPFHTKVASGSTTGSSGSEKSALC